MRCVGGIKMELRWGTHREASFLAASPAHLVRVVPTVGRPVCACPTLAILVPPPPLAWTPGHRAAVRSKGSSSDHLAPPCILPREAKDQEPSRRSAACTVPRRRKGYCECCQEAFEELHGVSSFPTTQLLPDGLSTLVRLGGLLVSCPSLV